MRIAQHLRAGIARTREVRVRIRHGNIHPALSEMATVQLIRKIRLKQHAAAAMLEGGVAHSVGSRSSKSPCCRSPTAAPAPPPRLTSVKRTPTPCALWRPSPVTPMCMPRAQWPPPGQLPGFALIVIGVLIVVRLRAARAHGAQAGLDLVEVQGAHERITDDHGPHAVRGPLLELAGDHAAAPLPCRGGPVHGQPLPRFFDGATHQRSRRLGWRGPCSLAPLA